MLHRRTCQRCGRSVGEFLLCAKCPVVMHKFCVKAEGWGDFDDSSNSAQEGEGGEGGIPADGENSVGHEVSYKDDIWESDEDEDGDEDEGEDSDFTFQSSYRRPKGSVAGREGLRRAPGRDGAADADPRMPGRLSAHDGGAGGREHVDESDATSQQEQTPARGDGAVLQRLAPTAAFGTGNRDQEAQTRGLGGGETAPRRDFAPNAHPLPMSGAVLGGAGAGSDVQVGADARMGAWDSWNVDRDWEGEQGLLRVRSNESSHIGSGGGGNDTKGPLGAAALAGTRSGGGTGGGHAEMKERLLNDADWRLCAKILDALVKKQDGQHFLVPALELLPAEEHANYSSVVKKPLDLGIVCLRFRDGYYSKLWQLGDDVRLVFSNAISYHSSEHKMYKAARRLRKFVSDVSLELALELQQADTVGEWPHDYMMLLKRMIKTKDAQPFLKSVDPEADQCPDYYTIITRPMALEIVASQLQNGTYASPHDYAADIRLTLNNAITYNPKKHPLHAAAERVLKSFETNFQKLQLPRPPPTATSSSKRLKGKRSTSAGGAEDEGGGVGGMGQNATFRRSNVRWLCSHHRCVSSNRCLSP